MQHRPPLPAGRALAGAFTANERAIHSAGVLGMHLMMQQGVNRVLGMAMGTPADADLTDRDRADAAQKDYLSDWARTIGADPVDAAVAYDFGALLDDNAAARTLVKALVAEPPKGMVTSAVRELERIPEFQEALDLGSESGPAGPLG